MKPTTETKIFYLLARQYSETAQHFVSGKYPGIAEHFVEMAKENWVKVQWEKQDEK